jgi:hypothetical protein
MPLEMLTPIVGDRSRRIHYFNGRVLTAEDLQVEQDAVRLRDQLLGRAVGEGVVEGLVVRRAADSLAAVTISAGLALNRDGTPLVLEEDVTVAVLPDSEATEAGDALFVPCPEAASASTSVPVGTGVYVLLAAPASLGEGLAPRVGLGDDGVARSCETRFVAEGIQFRLAHLDVDDDRLVPASLAPLLRKLMALDDPPVGERSRLRNLLGHWCLGTLEIGEFAGVHFDGAGLPAEGWSYGPLDRLRALEEGDPDRIAGCELPLALLLWRSDGIALVDRWAVRRRPAPPPASDPWAPQVGLRRLAEAEAAFLHFQEHLEELAEEGVDPRGAAAAKLFAILPPGGCVPAVEGSAGAFFEGFDAYPETLDEALVRQHLFASWLEEPLRLPEELREEERPPLVLHRHDDYVLFRRATRHVDGEPWEPGEPDEPDGPGDPAFPGTGRIEVTVEGALERMSAFADAYRRGEARLLVEDPASGRSYPLEVVGQGGVQKERAYLEKLVRARYARTPRVRFTTGRIAAGRYRVALRWESRREQSVDLARKEVESVNFTLRGRGKEKPSVRPDREKGVGAELDERYGKYVLVPELVGERWPPPDPRDHPWWHEVDPLDDPSPEVLEWAVGWGRWIQESHPGAVVDPEDPLIFVDPGHDPGAVAEAPYAYVAFGEKGGYAPLLVTEAARTLEREVEVEGALLPESSLGRRAAGSSVATLDALGAAWPGLVSEVVGVGEETAAGLIGDARADVEDRKGSLRIFGGVDPGMEDALEGAGFSDAVALANATPDALVQAAGDVGLTAAHARVLVDKARQVAPAGSWDLARAGLGLDAGALAALGKEDISTVGDFRAASADAQRREALRLGLGISEATLERMDGVLESSFTEARRSLAGGDLERAPVTRAPGVDEEAAGRLGASGIRTVGELARADRTVVVDILGEASADVALTGARESMPVTTVGEVSLEVARRLNRQGVRTVGTLAGGDADALAGIFGDREAAEAAIAGARQSLLGR